jgi:hypothetical protein
MIFNDLEELLGLKKTLMSEGQEDTFEEILKKIAKEQPELFGQYQAQLG